MQTRNFQIYFFIYVLNTCLDILYVTVCYEQSFNTLEDMSIYISVHIRSRYSLCFPHGGGHILCCQFTKSQCLYFNVNAMAVLTIKHQYARGGHYVFTHCICEWSLQTGFGQFSMEYLVPGPRYNVTGLHCI